MTVQNVARICHETNRAYCVAQGDNSQPQWETAPDWQKQSAINGVIFHRNNPDATPAASHDSWLEEKLRAGWVYGAEKNPERKEHPCCVRFDRLPPEQQAKDRLFKGIIDALRDLIESSEPMAAPQAVAEKPAEVTLGH